MRRDLCDTNPSPETETPDMIRTILSLLLAVTFLGAALAEEVYNGPPSHLYPYLLCEDEYGEAPDGFEWDFDPVCYDALETIYEADWHALTDPYNIDRPALLAVAQAARAAWLAAKAAYSADPTPANEAAVASTLSAYNTASDAYTQLVRTWVGAISDLRDQFTADVAGCCSLWEVGG